MKKIIFLALAVYFLLAPFTYHPDTKLVLYYPTLDNGKVWDIYTYLNTHQDDAPKFHYPPMHYWVLKAEFPLVRLIGGNGVTDWIKSGGNSAFKNENVFLYNLATKVPLILLVVLTGWLIGQIMLKNGYKKKTANLAMLIWFFNPITVYSGIIMGQNDILAICPFVMGLWFYFDNPLLAFMLFGLGGSIKSYPLIWAIMLAIVYPNSKLIKKVYLATIPIVFYVLTMLPFLGLSYFKQDVLYSGLSIRVFDSAIDIGLGDKILLVPLILTGLAMVGLKKKSENNLRKIVVILIATTFTILSFTHFNPQWLIWIMPFAAMEMAESKDYLWLWALIASWVGIIMLFNDKFLVWGLISPLNPDLINLPLFSEILLSKGVDTTLLNNLCHSIIGGLTVYWIYNSVKE